MGIVRVKLNQPQGQSTPLVSLCQKNMNDILKETLRLVFSSTRSMPAHFCSDDKRKQTFFIDFEPLNVEADYNMASESWGATSDFLSIDKCGNEKLSESQFNTVTRCGEDIMVGAFILTKLGGDSIVVETKKEILENTMKFFAEKIEDLKNVLAGPQVNKYFDYCIEYGLSQAKQN